MLAIRRDDSSLAGADLEWLPSPDEVLAFARGSHFINLTNLSAAPIALPADCSLLLASTELVGGLLPPDATAWLRPQGASLHDRTLRSPIEGGE